MVQQFPIKNLPLLVIGGLFALPFAAMGVEMGLSVLELAGRELQTRSWVETPCTIVAVNGEGALEPNRPFEPFRIEYRYAWQNVERTGTEVSRLMGYDGQLQFRQQMYEAWERLRKTGQPTRCWVDPQHPTDAVLIRDARWDFVTLQTLGAMAFSGGCGWGLAAILFSVYDQWRRTALEYSVARPWESRTDWASGRIVQSSRRKARLAIGFTGWFLIISAPPLFSGLRALEQGHGWAVLGLVPAGITLGFYLLANRLLDRWKRFGDSVLTLAAVPGVIGGELRGVIRPQRLIESPHGYQLHLRCTESQSRGDDETSFSIVWEEARLVTSELLDAATGELAIPVLIPVPFEAPPTLLGPINSERWWKLHVKSMTPGHGYQATFEVPLFRTADSQRDAPLEGETAHSVLAPVDPLATIKAAGILVDTLDHDGLRFMFPAGRNPAFHLAIVFGQGLFAAIAGGLLYAFWPVGWFWSAILLGTLVGGSLVDRLCYRSQVEVSSEGLAVRGGWLMLGRPKLIRAEEVQSMYLADMGSIGTQNCVNVGLSRKRGWPIVIAKYLIPSAVAERVQSQINARLRAGTAESVL